MPKGEKPKSNKRLELFIVAFILLAATVLRLWDLTSIPNGFHRDEALFGYEAYSIAKTSRDEHGRFMPIWFEGFGVIDYPLAIYPRVPFIAVLGLNVFAVRFSLEFYGIVTVLLLYLLARKMFPDRLVAIFALIIAGFSTWHFFMSRYTPGITALMFLVLGLYLLLYGRRRLWNILGGVSLGLTCFTYASYYFFLPPFLLLMFLVFFHEIKRDKNIRDGFIAVVAVTVLAFALFWNINLQRAPQTAFYFDKRIIEYTWGDKPVGQRFALGGSYDFVERVLYNPRLGYVHKIISNYIDGFSTNYWLKTGRGFESNVDGFGNLLVYEPFLAIIGALYLFWKRSKLGIFLVGWVLIGPLASTFTKDVTSTRLLHMVPAFVLLEAAALAYLVRDILKLRYKALAFLAIASIFIPILFFNMLYYNAYFRHMSAYSGVWWQKGYFETIDMTNKYPQKQVYMKGKWDFSYILFAFRNKYDPALFQKEAKREKGNFNFDTVTDFGRFHFVDDIKKGRLCRDYNSIYIERIGANESAPEMFVNEITSVGSDRFVYFIPTKKVCEGYMPTDPNSNI